MEVIDKNKFVLLPDDDLEYELKYYTDIKKALNESKNIKK